MGMIQRNSVILIDQIEQDRAAAFHLGRHCRSGVRRLRPIVLTPLPPCWRMIPLAQRCFGAHGGGHHGRLIVATVLTLLALPGHVRRLVQSESGNCQLGAATGKWG